MHDPRRERLRGRQDLNESEEPSRFYDDCIRAHRNQFQYSIDNTDMSIEDTARAVAAYVRSICATTD